MSDLPALASRFRTPRFEAAGATPAPRTVEVELAVGESVRIDGVFCTVVEIADGEVHLRVDPADAPAAACDEARYVLAAR